MPAVTPLPLRSPRGKLGRLAIPAHPEGFRKRLFQTKAERVGKKFESLHAAMRIRNYSGKTLEDYLHWMRKFQDFVRSKSPNKVDAEDVKEFLTHLAAEQGVAASTQN